MMAWSVGLCGNMLDEILHCQIFLLYLHCEINKRIMDKKSDLIIGQAKEEFRKFIAYEILLITGRENGFVPLDCTIRRIEGDEVHQLSSEIITGVRRDIDGNIFVQCYVNSFIAKNFMEYEINEMKVICDEIEKVYLNNLNRQK